MTTRCVWRDGRHAPRSVYYERGPTAAEMQATGNVFVVVAAIRRDLCAHAHLQLPQPASLVFVWAICGRICVRRHSHSGLWLECTCFAYELSTRNTAPIPTNKTNTHQQFAKRMQNVPHYCTIFCGISTGRKSISRKSRESKL